jgi:hypothetical protein
MGMCYIDKDNGTTGLTDEERKEYEFSTHYHPETKTNTNRCPRQYNIDNQRRK